MAYKVDNAIIMAAGYASRFAPISYECPKALMKVKGEVLIERQIRQLKEAGIDSIIIVIGYMKERFYYLQDKYAVQLVENPVYNVRNNHSSIYAVRNQLNNTYICSADNYFTVNPFESEVEQAYYAALYAPGETKEWCLTLDEDDWITGVSIGGNGQWYMLGHVFWSEEFSKIFRRILEEEYGREETRDKLWEALYIEHLDLLKLKVRKFADHEIYEFDSLEELREFDRSYMEHSGSAILQSIADILHCLEKDIIHIIPEHDAANHTAGFSFTCRNCRYIYRYENKQLERKKQ